MIAIKILMAAQAAILILAVYGGLLATSWKYSHFAEQIALIFTASLVLTLGFAIIK